MRDEELANRGGAKAVTEKEVAVVVMRAVVAAFVNFMIGLLRSLLQYYNTYL
jgi:hypothetical protein